MGCGGRKRGDSVEQAPLPFQPKAFSLSVIDWLHVASLYVPHVLTAGLVFAVAALVPPAELTRMGSHPEHVLAVVLEVWAHVTRLWYAYAILLACITYALTTKPSVYLMDFAVYEAPRELQVSRAELVEIMNRIGTFTPDSLNFMTKLLNSSGTGEATAWPPGTVRLLRRGLPPLADGEPHLKPDTSMAAARASCEGVLVSVMESLLARTGVKAKDIDFLIVNCSLFCPTPSLASIIIREFGLRTSVRSYNLGGMGCSASLIAIDLAKQLLQNKPHSIAVVLSTEEITQSLYTGNDRSMLVQNTLFRVGGAAMLLSNRPIDGFRARYKLLHTVRVQEPSPGGQGAVVQQEDATGTKGIFLSKDITKVAGQALTDNFTMLGPRVLPFREMAKVAISVVQKKLCDSINRSCDALKIARIPFTGESGRLAKVRTYTPDFKAAISHFCIHAGGRAVIETIEKNLNLSPVHTAPSRATLFHYGNTSSSSIWYELRYCEGEAGYWRGVPADKRPKDAGPWTPSPAPSPAPAIAAGGGGGGGGSLTSSASTASLAGSSVASAGDGGTPKRLGASDDGLASPPGTPSSASASSSSASVSAPVRPTSEAIPDGWDPARKWHLPDYEGRHVAPGDRVLQIAFGSGFKCNSAVWLRMR